MPFYSRITKNLFALIKTCLLVYIADKTRPCPIPWAMIYGCQRLIFGADFSLLCFDIGRFFQYFPRKSSFQILFWYPSCAHYYSFNSHYTLPAHNMRFFWCLANEGLPNITPSYERDTSVVNVNFNIGVVRLFSTCYGETSLLVMPTPTF